MVSERIQRRIDRLLDEAETAADAKQWSAASALAREALALDEESADAHALLAAALHMLDDAGATTASDSATPVSLPRLAPALPASFVSGRYRVLRILGEGGRKRVYLAHDERLDRDVAFAVIKTDGLDAMGRERIRREARAMARIGAHPNLVAIHDIGDEGGDSYLVQEYMDGGDLAVGVSQQPMAVARLDWEIVRVLGVAKDVARGLAFIHRAGIVHRDLKPANVFLAKGGTAKVGDFGLAMAADLTRITQHGTFVGTVAYMPPEQAVGGDVTAKSDLYSFGALLYELVTGRPPFTGDDPTAIISQHLNTPPVAPSWQREDCPPGLERVILALLEKDPGKRPADAAEVLVLLEKVDPEERAAPRSEGHVLERLARGVFVGREKELERLRKAFDEAFSGRGRLVMLVGEPGIGKTLTAQELETYARMRGAQVLWGRSHESSGAPAFWPWVQVGRGWGGANDVNTLTPFLASGGSELARLFPELRAVPGYVEPPQIMDGAAAQFRLFDAFSSFVRTISDQKPAVVTLDDLHWADKPTLQLLQHLARELARMRVLVVCTYRDTDLVRTHPLSEALAELNREPGFERVVLRGLGKDEVRSYIAAAANLQPSNALVERIYEETEGNPFFLSEVVNLLTQEGTLANDSVSDIRIPDGVKEALGRRLDRISPEANTLLQVAAVVGREFTYDTLQLLHAGDDDDLLKRIEEGLEGRVIEEMEQPGRYRFTHALMQETLLGELSTTRRVRLHGQVGEALERRWGDRAEEYAARLAPHFIEAATLSSDFADRACSYALAAARAAEAQSAWDAASIWYDYVVQSKPDSDATTLRGWARSRVHATGIGTGRQERAAMLRALDAVRSRAHRGEFAEALAGFPWVALDSKTWRALYEEALADIDNDPSPVRITLLFSLQKLLATTTQDYASLQAVEVELDALTLQATSLEARAIQLYLQTHRLLRRGLFLESSKPCVEGAAAFEELGRLDDAVWLLEAAAGWGLLRGQLDYAEEHNARLEAFSQKHRSAAGRQLALQQRLALAVARWRPDEFDREPSPSAGEEGSFARVIRGDSGQWDSPLTLGRGAPPTEAMQALARHAAAQRAMGLRSLAKDFVVRWAEHWRGGVGSLPQRATSLTYACMCLDELDHVSIEIAYAEAKGWKNWCGTWSGLGLDSTRGLLALRLDLIDEAEQCFSEGLEWSRREGCPVEEGRNLQGLAAVAERRGDIPAALRYLDIAAAQFAPRGVKLFLDQVIAKKVELQGLSGSDPYTSIVAVSRAVQAEQPAIAAAAAVDGIITIMFSDIENSTALNERLGDAAWMEILRAHNALVEREVATHAGRVVKTIGDGYMVVFSSPESGVRGALAIQAALASPPDILRDIHVRIGLHTGSAVREGADFFGREVNYAARVASSALGGEVLVSAALRERLGSRFAVAGSRVALLKGFDGEHELAVLTHH